MLCFPTACFSTTIRLNQTETNTPQLFLFLVSLWYNFRMFPCSWNRMEVVQIYTDVFYNLILSGHIDRTQNIPPNSVFYLYSSLSFPCKDIFCSFLSLSLSLLFHLCFAAICSFFQPLPLLLFLPCSICRYFTILIAYELFLCPALNVKEELKKSH